MRKIIIASFVFLNLIVFKSIGQFQKRPFEEVSIVLKKGDTLTGLGKLSHLKEKLFFKEHTESEPVIYSFHDFKEITFFQENTVRYVFIISRRSETSFPVRKLARPVLNGDVCLFMTGGLSLNHNFGPNGFTPTASNTTRYYLKRSEEKRAIDIGRPSTYSRKFKDLARTYFSDCPDLLDKINTKYFSRFDIEAIVKYYNQCKE
ncbi:hypothetical protein [Flagellimonas sp. 2504JD4-2]